MAANLSASAANRSIWFRWSTTMHIIPMHRHHSTPPAGSSASASVPALSAADDDLPGGELPQPLAHPGSVLRVAEERRHALDPEHLPEHARRAEQAPRLVVERAEPRLDHGHHRLRQLGAGALGRLA